MGAFSYNVAPRYTCGSPAMVDRQTCEKVAAEEKEAYAHALDGSSGERDRSVAEAAGLDFIAYTMRELKKTWEVDDLITGKRHVWPFTGACPACGAKGIRTNRGKLVSHRSCAENTYYVGKEVRLEV